MRAYSADDEEALRARYLLKDWVGEGFVTTAQYQQMEPETVCELRRTNIFLRVVLFLFTLLIVAAVVGLVFTSSPGRQAASFILLFAAAVCYAGAEFAVSEGRFYRHGVEEALLACSVGFLCAGISSAFFSDGTRALNPVVLLAGTLLSLWIWHRFALAYMFLAAMAFIVWLPGYWTASHGAQHLLIAAIFAVGLIPLITFRSRNSREYLNERYSLAEAFLWLGIYLAINLQLSQTNLLTHGWSGPRDTSEFSSTLYWATWAAIWCLPPAILWRSLKRIDRFVIAAGALAMILTLVTNKPYLGWPRHAWDPMLMGALLVGIALFIQRWLKGGADGIRSGFTGRRLSGKDKQWMNAGSTAFSVLSQPGATPATAQPKDQFGGGESGGGGASSDF